MKDVSNKTLLIEFDLHIQPELFYIGDQSLISHHTCSLEEASLYLSTHGIDVLIISLSHEMDLTSITEKLHNQLPAIPIIVITDKIDATVVPNIVYETISLKDLSTAFLSHLIQCSVDHSNRPSSSTSARLSLYHDALWRTIEKEARITTHSMDVQTMMIQELKSSDSLYRMIFDSTGTAMVMLEEDTTILLVNREFERLSGYNREDIEGKVSWKMFIVSEDLNRMLEYHNLRRIQNDLAPEQYECRCVNRNNEVRVCHINVAMVPNSKRSLISLWDITPQTEVETALRESEEKFRIISSSAKDAIILIDNNGNISFWNNSAELVFGYPRIEALGKNAHQLLVDPKYAGQYAIGFRKFKKTGTGPVIGQTVELSARHRNGTIFPVELSVSAVKLNNRWCAIGVARDITERKRMEEARLRAAEAEVKANAMMLLNQELENEISQRIQMEKQLAYLATHDHLTGLPNRMLFTDRLLNALRLAERHKHKLAVIFLDLDRFKYVNDTYGHDVGDIILVGAAQRLKYVIRQSDTVARMGGDEFYMLLPQINSIHDATLVAQKIVDCFSEPFPYGDISIKISTSVGIAVFPDHGHEANILVKNSDIALYEAKLQGRNTFIVYNHQELQTRNTP